MNQLMEGGTSYLYREYLCSAWQRNEVIRMALQATFIKTLWFPGLFRFVIRTIVTDVSEKVLSFFRALFHTENGGGASLQYIDNHLPDYKTSQSIRYWSS
jgi:hypothetical protein